MSSSSCAVAAEDFPWNFGGAGVIDLRAQAEVPSALRSDTPNCTLPSEQVERRRRMGRVKQPWVSGFPLRVSDGLVVLWGKQWSYFILPDRRIASSRRRHSFLDIKAS